MTGKLNSTPLKKKKGKNRGLHLKTRRRRSRLLNLSRPCHQFQHLLPRKRKRQKERPQHQHLHKDSRNPNPHWALQTPPKHHHPTASSKLVFSKLQKTPISRGGKGDKKTRAKTGYEHEETVDEGEYIWDFMTLIRLENRDGRG